MKTILNIIVVIEFLTKVTLKLLSVTLIFVLFASNSFSTPLSGTYTVGTSGDYPTINSAANDVMAQGVNGPVIFDILSGIYYEKTVIQTIPGTSSINTVTFKSQTGNAGDVEINGHLTIFTIVGTSYLRFQNITLGFSLSGAFRFAGVPDNIIIQDNIFLNESIAADQYGVRNIIIKNNTGIENIFLDGIDMQLSYNAEIVNNSINGFLHLGLFASSFVENNSMEYLYMSFCDGVVKNNKIRNRMEINNCAELSVFNNFICGNSSLPVLFFSASNDIQFFHNSILNYNSTQSTLMEISYCTEVEMKNNLLINSTGGTVLNAINTFGDIFSNSDYNDYYNGGNENLIVYNGTSYNTVSDFYNATSLDQHSNSQSISFESTTDLHLSETSIGDEQLAGIPVALVPDDIDGEVRSIFNPYKGADETDFTLPVELSSFTSSVNNNIVTLNWATSSETNNSGFQVERSAVKGEWLKVNFVKGNGNSSIPQNYSYEDKNISAGKYKYRLKQVDFNGNYEYFNLTEEIVVGIPDKFELSQNYPNPFNPQTNLEYEISNAEFVSLKIYDLLGNEIMTLVNETKQAGRHRVVFDGSNLSSGVYLYKIQTGEFSAVKRMTLIK